MPGGRSNDIAAIAAQIDARPDRACAVRHCTSGVLEDDVLATATGQKTPGLDQGAVLPFERGECLVTAMTRIDVESDDAADGPGRDPDVHLVVFEPSADDVLILACVAQAVRSQLCKRMLCRGSAISLATGATESRGIADGPVQRQHRDTHADVPESECRDGVQRSPHAGGAETIDLTALQTIHFRLPPAKRSPDPDRPQRPRPVAELVANRFNRDFQLVAQIMYVDQLFAHRRSSRRTALSLHILPALITQCKAVL